jgi:hypothetical protein
VHELSQMRACGDVFTACPAPRCRVPLQEPGSAWAQCRVADAPGHDVCVQLDRSGEKAAPRWKTSLAWPGLATLAFAVRTSAPVKTTKPSIRTPLTPFLLLQTPLNPGAIESHEFVTAGYIGNLPGDPRGGATRCLTNNIFDAGFSGTTAYFCGTQVRARGVG